MNPRDWCVPKGSFGDPNALNRHWEPPSSETELPLFRAAVVQHAIAVSVRRWKNAHGKMTQDQLATLDKADGRPGSNVIEWNARLNGRRTITLADIAVIIRHLPEAMPTEDFISTLLRVAEKEMPRPTWWSEVDS